MMLTSTSATSDIGVGTAFVVGLLVGVVLVLRVIKAIRAEFRNEKETEE